MTAEVGDGLSSCLFGQVRKDLDADDEIVAAFDLLGGGRLPAVRPHGGMDLADGERRDVEPVGVDVAGAERLDEEAPGATGVKRPSGKQCRDPVGDPRKVRRPHLVAPVRPPQPVA